jgi:hypothetical protein
MTAARKSFIRAKVPPDAHSTVWTVARSSGYGRFHDRHRVSLHALMVLFSFVPSLMGYTVYLTDLPNAVARITINLKLIADPSSSTFYSFKPVLVPNMAWMSGVCSSAGGSARKMLF